MTRFRGRLCRAEGEALLRRARLFDWLSDEERARAARYRAGPAGLFVARRVFLREVLAEELGVAPCAVPIRTENGGRPAIDLEGEVPFFSQSSTGDATVVAVSDEGAVGVDLESLDRVVDFAGIARRWFSPGEVGRIEANPSADGAWTEFLTIWTAREAVAKLTGEGMVRAMGHHEVLTDPLRVVDVTALVSYAVQSTVTGRSMTTVAFSGP